MVDDLAGVFAFAGHWQEHRHDLPYEIDGVVAKVDDLAQRLQLGFTSRRRAGPLPSSFHQRNAPRSCATSRSRSVEPGARLRSPCWIRCSSVAPRCGWRRCTTRIRYASKMCAPATR